MQRLRISFSRGENLKFLSHLDLIRLWERTFRRANIQLAYSEGFTPHAKISFAAPLSVGTTSEEELMDVFLTGWCAPSVFECQMSEQLPVGIHATDVKIIGIEEASLQSRVRFAEYVVESRNETRNKTIEVAIKELLSSKEIPWQHQRDTGCKTYDLRPLVDNIWLIEIEELSCTIGMRLLCSTKGAGRPEQVTKALGFAEHPLRIHRTKLILN